MSRILQHPEISTDPDTGHIQRSPLVIECNCGRKLEHYSGPDVDCHCGAIYNAFGQLLAPRQFWGEETGETLADIYCGKDEDY